MQRTTMSAVRFSCLSAMTMLMKQKVYRLFGPLPSEISPHSGDEPQHTHPPKRKRSIDEKSLRWTIAGVLIAGVGVLVSVLLAIFL